MKALENLKTFLSTGELDPATTSELNRTFMEVKHSIITRYSAIGLSCFFIGLGVGRFIF